MILFLQILGGIAAVALGFYLGNGRYTQTQAEIEARLGGGKPRRAKRHFMWLNYFRTVERASDRGRKRPIEKPKHENCPASPRLNWNPVIRFQIGAQAGQVLAPFSKRARSDLE